MRKTNINKGSGCFEIKLDIYPMDVIFSFNQSTEQVHKSLIEIVGKDLLKEEDFENSAKEAGAHSGCMLLSNNDAFIRILPICRENDLHGAIAHEIFHATTFIMHELGCEFEMNVSDEAYAYLLGYITNEVYKKIEF